MTGETAGRLSRARELVGEALKQWDAFDLESVDRCRLLVEQSVSEMRECEAGLRAATNGNAADLRAAARDLQKEITHMMRMVDAGAAFYRGLATRLGATLPVYNAAGQIPFEAPPCAERELHG